VGGWIRGFRDFYPTWIAANLQAQGFQAAGVTIEFPHLRDRKFVNSRTLADLFDAGLIQDEINTAIRKLLASSPLLSPSRLAFPACSDCSTRCVSNPNSNASWICQCLKFPLCPFHPRDASGIHPGKALALWGAPSILASKSPRLMFGTDGRLARVWSSSSARSLPHTSGDSSWRLAVSWEVVSSNSGGEIHERVFGLPLDYPAVHKQCSAPNSLNPNGHPVFRVGVRSTAIFSPSTLPAGALSQLIPRLELRWRL